MQRQMKGAAKNMAARSRYQHYQRARREGEGAPKAERQANFLTFQIIMVLLLLGAVFLCKHFGLKVFEDIRRLGDLLLGGKSESVSTVLDYKTLEDIFSGNFEFDLSSFGAVSFLSLGPAGLLLPRESGARGGSFPGVLQGGDGAYQRPRSVSFSPLLLSAQPKPPVAGRVTSGFGWRENPTGEGVDFHTGLDIAAAEGTPILASLPGVVEDTGYSESYGNFVHLSHANGLMTTYSHCSEIIAQPGERVRQGERLALVGQTGNVTGPHLHFEVRQDNLCYDPMVQLLPYRSASVG